MASDGGHANAGPYDNQPGMSVRDEFAKAIAKHVDHPADSSIGSCKMYAHEIYTFAQALTDEKLRRDKADRDEGKAG